MKASRVGDDHPDTLASLHNLALLFHNKGEYDRALPLFEECLAKRKRVLGDDQPYTKNTKKWRDVRAESLQESSHFLVWFSQSIIYMCVRLCVLFVAFLKTQERMMNL